MPVRDLVRKHPRKIILGAIGLLFLGLAIPGGSYGYWAYQGKNDFCASCHIMGPAHVAWQQSAHRDVECKTCHAADAFTRAKFGLSWVLGAKEVGPHSKLDTGVCKSCHESDDARWKQIAGTRGHRVHNERARLACLECHARTVHKFEPEVQRCRECHTERLILPKMAKALAEETGGKECFACHKFAVKDSASLQPQRPDCIACHQAMEVPPARESGEPFHADCRGCHTVHTPPRSDPALCIGCHTAVLATDGKHVADGRLEKCTECHEPHVWRIE